MTLWETAVVRADANGAYTTAEAIQVVGNVEDFELECFEQPVPGRNMQQHSVRESLPYGPEFGVRY